MNTLTHPFLTEIPKPGELSLASGKATGSLEDQNARLRSAIQYCLRCLKSHHMTKPGISTPVRKTENILSNGRREP
jgi:hypothetical protein